jgi:hypothetical protein
MALLSGAAALQNAVQDIARVRKYVWDGPYDEVARWESAALEAVGEAFGRESAELAELSAVIQDQQWKNTNRPDAVSPEVFVNRDFQSRMDRLEAMLNGYIQKLQAGQEQKPQEEKAGGGAAAGSAARTKAAGRKKKRRVAASAKKGASRRNSKAGTRAKAKVKMKGKGREKRKAKSAKRGSRNSKA